MKVYAVMCNVEYEGSEVLAITATPEKAVEIKRHYDAVPEERADEIVTYTIVEWEVI